MLERTQLEQRHELLAHAGPFPHVDLAKAEPDPDGAQQAFDRDVVHADSIVTTT